MATPTRARKVEPAPSAADTYDDTLVRLQTERVELRRQLKTPPEIA